MRNDKSYLNKYSKDRSREGKLVLRSLYVSACDITKQVMAASIFDDWGDTRNYGEIVVIEVGHVWIRPPDEAGVAESHKCNSGSTLVVLIPSNRNEVDKETH